MLFGLEPNSTDFEDSRHFLFQREMQYLFAPKRLKHPARIILLLLILLFPTTVGSLRVIYTISFRVM